MQQFEGSCVSTSCQPFMHAFAEWGLATAVLARA